MAVRAGREAARRVGLSSTDSRVLRDANNTLVVLPESKGCRQSLAPNGIELHPVLSLHTRMLHACRRLSVVTTFSESRVLGDEARHGPVFHPSFIDIWPT
jgi:hypothetical protein